MQERKEKVCLHKNVINWGWHFSDFSIEYFARVEKLSFWMEWKSAFMHSIYIRYVGASTLVFWVICLSWAVQFYVIFCCLRDHSSITSAKRWMDGVIFALLQYYLCWIRCVGLKVALSQKILENFYISNINIPNHYPEQKIWISHLKQ